MSPTSSWIYALPHVQKSLTQYVYPVWFIFGFVGCVFNLIIFSRPHLRTTSCSIYFFAASADHLITLIVGIGTVLYGLDHPDPQIQSLLFCKLRGYIFQICLMLSRWFVAMACIDRYMITSNQTNLRNFSKPKVAYRIIIIVVIVWSIICSHRLIFYEIKGEFCGIISNLAAAFYHGAYVIIGGGILPITIMLIGAWLLRQNLTERQRVRAQFLVADHHQNSFQRHILCILFVQVLCYVIFTIPQLCNLTFNAISIMISDRSTEHLILSSFVNFLAEMILYLFPVTSFYLYTLTSHTFRNELVQFFRLLWKSNRNHQIISTVVFSNVLHHSGRTAHIVNVSVETL